MVHSAAPAAGEDGALLAQPLRHRLQQGRPARSARSTRTQDDGRQGRASLAGQRSAGRSSSSATWRTGSFRDAADRGGEGSGDAGLARRPAQHAAAAAGKLRPRDHGAVHPRRRQLHRGGRLRRGARVHRLELRSSSATAPAPPTSYYAYVYNAAQHDPTAKSSRSRSIPTARATIPARAAADGEQDGVDLILALARHPATADRLARKLYTFFVSETTAPSDGARSATCARRVPEQRLQHQGDAACGCSRRRSSSTDAPSSRATRWPVEYVVRAIKETGWNGLSVDTAMTPLVNMGQQLYEPPDVNGWALGPGWFSTASMLARMNFAVDADGATSASTCARRRQPYRGPRPSACSITCWSASRRAPLDGRDVATRCSTTCAGRRRGPAATRSCSKALGPGAASSSASSEYQFN